MPGDPHRAREASSRSGSPPKRGGEQERRVLGLRPFGPANISGFPAVTPSAGEQANPRHGFVSRPGGAFKFMAVHQMPAQAPKNPYQVPCAARSPAGVRARPGLRVTRRGDSRAAAPALHCGRACKTARKPASPRACPRSC